MNTEFAATAPPAVQNALVKFQVVWENACDVPDKVFSYKEHLLHGLDWMDSKFGMGLNCFIPPVAVWRRNRFIDKDYKRTALYAGYKAGKKVPRVRTKFEQFWGFQYPQWVENYLPLEHFVCPEWKKQVQELQDALKAISTTDYLFIYMLLNKRFTEKCSYEAFYRNEHKLFEFVEVPYSCFNKLLPKLKKKKKAKVAPQPAK